MKREDRRAGEDLAREYRKVTKRAEQRVKEGKPYEAEKVDAHMFKLRKRGIDGPMLARKYARTSFQDAHAALAKWKKASPSSGTEAVKSEVTKSEKTAETVDRGLAAKVARALRYSNPDSRITVPSIAAHVEGDKKKARAIKRYLQTEVRTPGETPFLTKGGRIAEKWRTSAEHTADMNRKHGPEPSGEQVKASAKTRMAIPAGSADRSDLKQGIMTGRGPQQVSRKLVSKIRAATKTSAPPPSPKS